MVTPVCTTYFFCFCFEFDFSKYRMPTWFVFFFSRFAHFRLFLRCAHRVQGLRMHITSLYQSVHECTCTCSCLHPGSYFMYIEGTKKDQRRRSESGYIFLSNEKRLYNTHTYYIHTTLLTLAYLGCGCCLSISFLAG